MKTENIALQLSVIQALNKESMRTGREYCCKQFWPPFNWEEITETESMLLEEKDSNGEVMLINFST